jgi:hypothetical protein
MCAAARSSRMVKENLVTGTAHRLTGNPISLNNSSIVARAAPEWAWAGAALVVQAACCLTLLRRRPT